ncbi:Asp23/Gls24 family envelope stress response protein [Nocardioides marinquilinus]|uniref:Asp23/Gls24 family envelope stress response protein n=1 Tax=Nocardioides marinquilinus TaxID=1210400 RepID=A0ABP9P9D2_9ACTN
MTQATDAAPKTSKARPTGGGSEVAVRESGGLVSDQGRTSIADTVVSKIAGIATREISGVHALGGGAARAVGAIRERIPGSRTNLSQGVGVEVGERQAAIDLDIVAEYGVSIADLAVAIRRNVIAAVEQMTSLEVTEVNITVHDIFLDDGGSDDTDTAPRVE